MVVDDVRFANEAEAMRAAGGRLYLIAGRGGIVGAHASENQAFTVDNEIDNAGAFEAFLEAVDGVARQTPSRRNDIKPPLDAVKPRFQPVDAG